MASAIVRKELECSICLKIFEEPVTLKCGHTFCQDCIADEFERTMYVDIDYLRYNVIYPCPQCKDPNFGKNPFAKNLNLCNMIKRIQSQPKNHEDLQVEEPDPTRRVLTKIDKEKAPNQTQILRTEQSSKDQQTKEHLHDSAMVSADLAKDLTCPLCQKMFRDPATLRCGHSFCCSCLNDYLETHKVMEGVFFEMEHYYCPECKDRYSEKPVWVRNRTLNKMAEHFSRQTNTS